MVGKKTERDTLRDRVVLITGATGGIGSALVKEFAKQEAIVCIHHTSRRSVEAKKLQEEISKYSISRTYQEDFMKQDIRLVKHVIKDFKRIDVLVNNAGIISERSIFDLEFNEYERVFRVNSFAPYILSRDSFQDMKGRRWGRILNISSFTVKYGMGRNSGIHYAGSKATLETLTTGLSRLGTEHNILVNTIRPGIINTPIQQQRADLDKRIQMVPLKRLGEPEEIADMALFLCSEKGSFITGQTITIGGGEG